MGKRRCRLHMCGTPDTKSIQEETQKQTTHITNDEVKEEAQKQTTHIHPKEKTRKQETKKEEQEGKASEQDEEEKTIECLHSRRRSKHLWKYRSSLPEGNISAIAEHPCTSGPAQTSPSEAFAKAATSVNSQAIASL